MRVLVTGGCGFIGSHTCCELLDNGYDVVIIDNLSNSKKEVIDSIKKITNHNVKFYEGDLCNKDFIRNVFSCEKIDYVIHFAGLKSVSESVKKPLLYYDNNIISTLNLCEVMNEFKCYNLIFSSSATVYGIPKRLPLTEEMELSTTNPYGSTKLMIEDILKDLYKSNNNWNIVILRYFNPIGAHKSYLIGENPNGIPNNLMPYIVKVALGELECLNIFGNDYDTIDGTGVRDYIHVVDLARGHVCALNKIIDDKGLFIYNLGTGMGYSVLQLVNTFCKVNNVYVNYKIVGRRAGDVSTCYADISKAQKELGFKPVKTIEDMCIDSYNYALKNKN